MDWPLILRAIGVACLIAGAIAIFRPASLMTHSWRSGTAFALGLTMLAASFWLDRPAWCGCQPAPVPNILLLDVGSNLLKRGEYAAAKSAFDDVIHDWKSAEIRPAATYGRALSEEKLGEAAAAQKDFATAANSKPSGAMQFKQFGS